MIIKEIDMASVIGQLIVTVKVSKTTRARMWLGTRAMGFAARIFGCKVDIVVADDQPSRAKGGMIKPSYYATGERGPELFTPRI